jgi:hypothetical protein
MSGSSGNKRQRVEEEKRAEVDVKLSDDTRRTDGRSYIR